MPPTVWNSFDRASVETPNWPCAVPGNAKLLQVICYDIICFDTSPWCADSYHSNSMWKKMLKIKKHLKHPRKTGHTLPWHIIIILFFCQINSSFFNKKIWCVFFFNNSMINNPSVCIAAFFSASINILFFWIELVQRTPGFSPAPTFVHAHAGSLFPSTDLESLPRPGLQDKYDSELTPTNTQMRNCSPSRLNGTNPVSEVIRSCRYT